MKKIKVRIGDTVKIIAGDQKGSDGKIIKIFKANNTALIEGINMVKKHNKPSSKNPKGGITEKESPVNISNISLINSKGETTRVGYKTIDGVKKRIALKSDEII